MHKRHISLFVSVLFASSVALPAGRVEVRLAIDERSLLPGTPTGLSVIVANRTNEEVQLPPSLWIVATNEAGKTFVVRSHILFHDTSGQELLSEKVRTVAPTASRELRFDASAAVAGSPWFMDDRLWAPARYRLWAVLALNVTPDGTFDHAAALISNEETLTVRANSDEDAAVWQWMQQQKWDEQAWLVRPRQLAMFVAKNHPKSEYMLYVATYLPLSGQDEPSPVFMEQIRRFPNNSFTDQLRLLLIHYRQQNSYVAYRHGELDRAVYDADAARSIASDLAQNSRSVTVRQEATEVLAHIPTQEQLLQKPPPR